MTFTRKRLLGMLTAPRRMKTGSLIALYCALAALAIAPASGAIALNPFASVIDGTPTDPDTERNYIADAVDIANGGVATREVPEHTYTIIDDPANILPLPIGDPIDQGGQGNLSPLTAGGYYLIVKYKGTGDDVGGLMFIVDGLSGDITVPETFPGNPNADRNNWRLFGAAAVVPDVGATGALLGIGVLALAALRRKS